MKLIAVVILFLSIKSYAAVVDETSAERITKACIASVESGGKRIANYQTVCRCIGRTHLDVSKKEIEAPEARARLRWAVEFYEEKDPAKLQRLSDDNPRFSSIDDQVINDCMN